jgi:magnesium chelatase subunit D
MALFAVDPHGCGGVALRAQTGPVRDRWLALLRAMLPEAVPWRRMPLGIGDGRLLGGLDLGATLQAGRPVAERGILAEADGGVVVLAMAERLTPGTAARLAGVLDTSEVRGERDGVALVAPARIGLVALDEGAGSGAADGEELLSAPLRDRMAFQVALESIGWRDAQDAGRDAATVAMARALLERVVVPPAMLDALCEAAAALGIASVRAPLLALRVARAAAALAGRQEAGEEDAAWAARLVLAPRATRMPQPQEPDPPSDPPPSDPPPAEDPPSQEELDGQDQPDQPDKEDNEGRPDDEQEIGADKLGEIMLEAARAAIPAGLLKQLQMGDASAVRGAKEGRQGAAQKGGARGRPVGSMAGMPERGRRLDVIETLRAAAPWQRIRAQERAPERAHKGGAVILRREDFRIRRCEQRARTVTIFVVDASGSSALNRLAEAKGAVELLLADCYQRRDEVAVLAFRGRAAQLLLPPTRSLVRAKRSLATLPGGGGTPLAAGIEAGFLLASVVRRGGFTPTIVLLTDGRANVTRAGTGGRAQAGQDAATAARLLRGQRIACLLVDTAPRPAPEAAALAREMGARYVPLPYADAASLSRSVRAAQRP